MSDQLNDHSAFARRAFVAFYVCGILYLGCRLLSYWLGWTLGETLLGVTGIYALRTLLQLEHGAVLSPARHRAHSKALWRAVALSSLGFALSAHALQGRSSAPSAELAMLFGAMIVPLFGFLGVHHWRLSLGASETAWTVVAAFLMPVLMPSLFLIIGHGVSPRALAASAVHQGVPEHALIGNFDLLLQQVHQSTKTVVFLARSLAKQGGANEGR